MKDYLVTGEEVKQRLDAYLCEKLPELTRSRLQKMIEKGDVLVDGRTEKTGYKLRKGDRITVEEPRAVPLDAVAQDIALEIVYEDGDLLVINKPAGMVTHPGAGVASGTLVNAVLFHCGDLSSIGGVIRPGIVHRLDKDTSGLIMVAKNDRAHIGLSAQLKEKTARREYLALVEGKPKKESGTINLPIGRHPTKRKQMTVMREDTPGIARDAVTHWTLEQSFSKYSLLALALETGRTHQIRVHLSHHNLPVVGDIVYNHKTTGTLEARHKLGLSGQALHAFKLSFVHPSSGESMQFTAPLPADLLALIGKLK